MPDPILERLLTDLPDSIRERFALLEKDRDDKASSLIDVTAENVRLHKQLDQGGSGIPVWTSASVISAGGTFIVPDGAQDNIVIPPGAVGVTLYLGGGLWPKIPKRPFLSIFADFCKVIGTPGRLTFDAPPSVQPGANGRYGFAECIRVGAEVPTATPVRGTVLIDTSAGRVDALAKCFPDCDGATFVRPVSTDAMMADGIFSGGARGVRIIDPDLRARTENTVRATSQNGIVSRDMSVIGGKLTNTGGKSACNPRNVEGFTLYGVTLYAGRNNAALGIGGGTPGVGDPGPSNVTAQDCVFTGGSIMLYAEARVIALLGNHFRWQERPDNTAISINDKAQGVTVIDNEGESPVPQKVMVGYVTNKANVKDLVERNNAWTVKP